mmetsp:Transcript_12096/g.23043  ORF Transcript_12096/g.23043 Transcript_12096/m.23043 type:complete len:153 (+) Transcript_12096:5079-5537(+)
MRSSVKPWSTEPSSWRAGALGEGREVEMLAVADCWKAALVARKPVELMAVAPPRGRNWEEALEDRREARRRAFMVASLATDGLSAATIYSSIYCRPDNGGSRITGRLLRWQLRNGKSTQARHFQVKGIIWGYNLKDLPNQICPNTPIVVKDF